MAHPAAVCILQLDLQFVGLCHGIGMAQSTWAHALNVPPEQIDRVAGDLGFVPEQHMRESYRELHERDAERRGVPPGDLLLEPAKDPS